jgi:hypothetical protein
MMPLLLLSKHMMYDLLTLFAGLMAELKSGVYKSWFSWWLQIFFPFPFSSSLPIDPRI